MDETALAVVGAVQVPELAAAEIAVGERAVGRIVEPLLMAVDAIDLGARERAVGDAGVGAGVLARLAGVEPMAAPGRALIGGGGRRQQHHAEPERRDNAGADLHGTYSLSTGRGTCCYTPSRRIPCVCAISLKCRQFGSKAASPGKPRTRREKPTT